MDFQPLVRFMNHLTSWHIPWAEVVVLRGNRTLFRYRSGFANLEERTPVQDGQIFNLYSMTKILTCTAGLQLLEKGRLLLNDPLSDYMPEYKEMTVRKQLADGSETLERAKRPITVRDLFTMTAGFSYNLESPIIREAVERTGGRLPTRELAAALAKEPLLYEPGTRWNYSLCHDVLAALVEVVGERKFSDYVRDEITGPLAMPDTDFRLTAEQQARLAPQYEFNEVENRPVRQDNNVFRLGTEYESGGAGLYSTVDDYIRLLQALTHGGALPSGARILSPVSVKLMQTDQLTEEQRRDFVWDHLAGYGYGLGVRTHVSKTCSGLLSSVGEFGWSGAAGCMALMDPAEELTVMYAQHLLNSHEPYVHPRLRNIIYACL